MSAKKQSQTILRMAIPQATSECGGCRGAEAVSQILSTLPGSKTSLPLTIPSHGSVISHSRLKSLPPVHNLI